MIPELATPLLPSLSRSFWEFVGESGALPYVFEGFSTKVSHVLLLPRATLGEVPPLLDVCRARLETVGGFLAGEE
jgi:hypothetical protein